MFTLIQGWHWHHHEIYLAGLVKTILFLGISLWRHCALMWVIKLYSHDMSWLYSHDQLAKHSYCNFQLAQTDSGQESCIGKISPPQKTVLKPPKRQQKTWKDASFSRNKNFMQVCGCLWFLLLRNKCSSHGLVDTIYKHWWMWCEFDTITYYSGGWQLAFVWLREVYHGTVCATKRKVQYLWPT